MSAELRLSDKASHRADSILCFPLLQQCPSLLVPSNGPKWARKKRDALSGYPRPLSLLTPLKYASPLSFCRPSFWGEMTLYSLPHPSVNVLSGVFNFVINDLAPITIINNNNLGQKASRLILFLNFIPCICVCPCGYVYLYMWVHVCVRTQACGGPEWHWVSSLISLYTFFF